MCVPVRVTLRYIMTMFGLASALAASASARAANPSAMNSLNGQAQHADDDDAAAARPPRRPPLAAIQRRRRDRSRTLNAAARSESAVSATGSATFSYS